ncbi:nuclear cap-binding protein subunit 1-like isoform X2 [Corticium candelabrum]|uniref:nuclear cap-binding protein subunit 1-like isoform X2 n=1 Tax=Corticium candelabrum TaxID=121492 RepID=UPI002E25D5B8|nr:nuclear cap-binding protein subunit 1-like isoform X2 [Corticium candelabrum]
MPLRFLADLVNANSIVPASVISLLESFVSVTMESNIPQVRSDWYIFAVLSCIPWVGAILTEKKGLEFDKLLDTIEQYIGKRSKDHVEGLRVWRTDEPLPQIDYLDSLWAQIKNMQKDDWKERFIPRPYVGFDSVLREALQHTLPPVYPPPHDESLLYPLPKVVFRLFDRSDIAEGPSLPTADSIDRYVVEEYLHSTIDVTHNDRKACALALVSFSGKSKLPLNYMLVEAIFSELFCLPSPPHLVVMYGSLLLELCKLNPSTLPVVLAQAVVLLFDRLETMNTVVLDRFAVWFSYHLSNFQYRWAWEDWEVHLSLSDDHPKRKFLSEALEMCIRLSYQQHIAEVLPESYSSFLPPDTKPVFKYGREVKESLPGSAIAQRFLTQINSKASLDELRSTLSELPTEPSQSGSLPMPVSLRLEVFLHIVLSVGSKSFSHVFMALAKFKSLFNELVASEDAQLQCLVVLFEFWQNSPQILTVLIEKMHRMKIISSVSVVKWLFHPAINKQFTKWYVWDILNQAMAKVVELPDAISKELHEAEEKLKLCKDEPDKASAELQDKAVSLTEDLEKAETERKELFLIIFQHFIMVLTQHVAECEKKGVDHHTLWFTCTRDRMRQLLSKYCRIVVTYRNTLEALLFTNEVESEVAKVYHQFYALVA